MENKFRSFTLYTLPLWRIDWAFKQNVVTQNNLELFSKISIWKMFSKIGIWKLFLKIDVWELFLKIVFFFIKKITLKEFFKTIFSS